MLFIALLIVSFVLILIFIKLNIFRDFFYSLLWKLLEVIGAVAVGVGIFLFALKLLDMVWAASILAIMFWFFVPIIKPYVDRFRKWIYTKLMGIDYD